MLDSICPKCGCKEILTDVNILNRSRVNTPNDFSAAIYENPHALIFQGGAISPITAYVCGECGYTEFYVARPQELLKAEKKRQKKEEKLKTKA